MARTRDSWTLTLAGGISPTHVLVIIIILCVLAGITVTYGTRRQSNTIRQSNTGNIPNNALSITTSSNDITFVAGNFQANFNFADVLSEDAIQFLNDNKSIRGLPIHTSQHKHLKGALKNARDKFDKTLKVYDRLKERSDRLKERSDNLKPSCKLDKTPSLTPTERKNFKSYQNKQKRRNVTKFVQRCVHNAVVFNIPLLNYRDIDASVAFALEHQHSQYLTTTSRRLKLTKFGDVFQYHRHEDNAKIAILHGNRTEAIKQLEKAIEGRLEHGSKFGERESWDEGHKKRLLNLEQLLDDLTTSTSTIKVVGNLASQTLREILGTAYACVNPFHHPTLKSAHARYIHNLNELEWKTHQAKLKPNPYAVALARTQKAYDEHQIADELLTTIKADVKQANAKYMKIQKLRADLLKYTKEKPDFRKLIEL